MKLRFGLYVLLAAFVPPLLALVITAEVAVPADAALESRLTAATSSVVARLDADAARRRELLLRLATLPGLTEPLREAASRARAPSAESVAQVRAAIADLFGREAPEIYAVATPQGAQVVITSGEPRQVPLAQLPLAAAAVSGQTVSSFVRFDGSLFRFYAMPVGVGEAALLIGDRVAVATANRLRDHAKVEHISFVEKEELVTASSLPVEDRDLALPAARTVGRSVSDGHLGTGLTMPFGLDEFLPLFSFADPYFPFLATKGLHRSLAAELSGGVSVVVTVSARRSLGWLGQLQALSLTASLVLLIVGGAWAAFMISPVNRQARSVEAHLSRLRVERGARIGLKGFSKPFIGVAEQLDALVAHLEQNTMPVPAAPKPPEEDSPPKPPKPLNLPLQTAPTSEEPDEPEGTPSAFPFDEGLRATGTDPAPAPEVRSAPEDKPAPEVRPAPEVKPAPGAAALVPERIVEAPLKTQGPVPLPAPRPPPPASTRPDPFAAFGPTPEPDTDRTREARIPEELLARSRDLESELLDPPEDPDEAHFREVYEQFVEMRRRNGEGADPRSFEQFAGTLRRNRDKLVERYACRTVRFAVYLKEGKAALKATPVK